MSDNKYHLNESTGDLHRAGEIIGNFNVETGELTIADAKFNKFRAPATRYLNSMAEEQQDTVTTAKEQEETAKAGDDASEKELEAIAKQEAQATAQAAADLESDKEFAKVTGCPEPPKKNPMYGDKTPNYVEWLEKYRPDVYAEKYGITGKGQVPVINDETGEVTYKEATMSKRKVHLTEKEASAEGIQDDESWDA